MESKLSHSAVVACPRNMVGRVIGKGGETIKALQQYTHAVIQIDQSQDPTRVTVAGEAESLKRAVSIIQVRQPTRPTSAAQRAGLLTAATLASTWLE